MVTSSLAIVLSASSSGSSEKMRLVLSAPCSGTQSSPSKKMSVRETPHARLLRQDLQ